ncbi:hypothetical protein BDW72DRAFT_61965 [Aspergillus terricola var. indicus]
MLQPSGLIMLLRACLPHDPFPVQPFNAPCFVSKLNVFIYAQIFQNRGILWRTPPQRRLPELCSCTTGVYTLP